MVRQKHWIICRSTRRILFVDMVLESYQKMTPAILCIFFSNKKGWNTKESREAMHYMREVSIARCSFFIETSASILRKARDKMSASRYGK